MYSLPATTAKGVTTTVGALIAGKVALIVNTASQCGFTPQLQGLAALHTKYSASQPFTVLAYPCNQFGSQEPLSSTGVEELCSTKFAATFPVMSKCDVNGDKADPLWTMLKEQKTGFLGFNGMCVLCRAQRGRPRCKQPSHPTLRPLPPFPVSSKWNFTKFLVDQKGQVIERYAPTTTPEAIAKDIEKLLA